MGKAELRIEIDAKLLADARAAGVALGDATEIGLRLAIAQSEQGRSIGIVASDLRQMGDPAGAQRRAQDWAKDNAEAIKTHNERIAARGIFGEDLRRW